MADQQVETLRRPGGKERYKQQLVAKLASMCVHIRDAAHSEAPLGGACFGQPLAGHELTRRIQKQSGRSSRSRSLLQGSWIYSRFGNTMMWFPLFLFPVFTMGLYAPETVRHASLVNAGLCLTEAGAPSHCTGAVQRLLLPICVYTVYTYSHPPLKTTILYDSTAKSGLLLLSDQYDY